MHLTIQRREWTRGIVDMGFLTERGRNFLGFILQASGVPDEELRAASSIRDLLPKYGARIPGGLIFKGRKESALGQQIACVNATTGILNGDREQQLLDLSRRAGIEVSFV